MGIAVMKDGELMEWKMKTFKGSLSEMKLCAIVQVIEEEISWHGINLLVIRKASEPSLTEGLAQLVSRITAHAIQSGIEVKSYSLDQLKKMCPAEGRVNKRVMIGHVMRTYSSLIQVFEKENRNRTSYYEKLFEAVAVVHFCSLELAGLNF